MTHKQRNGSQYHYLCILCTEDRSIRWCVYFLCPCTGVVKAEGKAGDHWYLWVVEIEEITEPSGVLCASGTD